MEWSGSAWRRLPLAARRPGPWLTRACSPPPPPPRQGRILPGGHGPAPPPASMAGRGGSRSGALRELCSFRFLRLTGVSAPPHPHPAGALRWPSIPVRLRFRRTPGAASPSSSLDSPASLLLRSRRPDSTLPSGFWLARASGHRHIPHRLSFRPAAHLRALPVPSPLRCSRVRRRPMPPSAAGVTPLSCGRSFGLCSTSYSPIRAPMAWDCSDSGQGEIPASFAGSGDTRGCRPLLGGAATAAICAPLRASGETLGPILRIGRRRRLGVTLLREGAVLYARGVLGSGSGDVGRPVAGLGHFSGWRA